MPTAFTRSCAVAATVAIAAAKAGVPRCAETGVGFDDPKRDAIPNGGRPGNNYTTIENQYAVSGPVTCEEASLLTDVISGEDSKSSKTLVGAGGPEAGSIPWWGIAAGGLGAAVVGAGAFAILAPGDKRKKVSKRGVAVGKDEGPKTAADLYAQMAGVEVAPAPAAAAVAPPVQFSQLAPMPQMASYAYAPQGSYVQVPTEPVQFLQVQP